MHKILVLGGYGGVGKAFIKLIFKYYNNSSQLEGPIVFLAGRNVAKAQNAVEEIQKEESNVKLEVVAADAADPDQMRHLCVDNDVDFVVNASNVPQYTEIVAKAAIEAGAHYLDFYLQKEPMKVLQSMEDDISAKNLVFSTSAGLHPGLPATLALRAAELVSDLEVIEIGLAMSMKMKGGVPSEALEELIELIPTMKMGAYVDGEWKSSYNCRNPVFEFTRGFGRASTYPMEMEELHAIFAMKEKDDRFKSLQTLGCFIAETKSKFVDWFVMGSAYVANSIKKGFGTKTLAKWYKYGDEKFVAGTGVACVLEARQAETQGQGSVRIVIDCGDAWSMTAAPAVANMLQLLKRDGDAPSRGVHLAALVPNPAVLLEDLRKMGLNVVEEVSNH